MVRLKLIEGHKPGPGEDGYVEPPSFLNAAQWEADEAERQREIERRREAMRRGTER